MLRAAALSDKSVVLVGGGRVGIGGKSMDHVSTTGGAGAVESRGGGGGGKIPSRVAKG